MEHSKIFKNIFEYSRPEICFTILVNLKEIFQTYVNFRLTDSLFLDTQHHISPEFKFSTSHKMNINKFAYIYINVSIMRDIIS